MKPRVLAMLLLILVFGACGKYGPPVRSAPPPPIQHEDEKAQEQP